MAIAVFNYSAWASRYPELAGAVDASRAALLFSEAGLYLDNTDASIVGDAGLRGVLLNMLVAHLAVLGGALDPGGVPSGMVGRVTSATEGSASISVEVPGAANWFSLTNYGLAFWQATLRYRRATYIPAPAYQTEPWGASPWRR